MSERCLFTWFCSLEKYCGGWVQTNYRDYLQLNSRWVELTWSGDGVGLEWRWSWELSWSLTMYQCQLLSVCQFKRSLGAFQQDRPFYFAALYYHGYIFKILYRMTCSIALPCVQLKHKMLLDAWILSLLEEKYQYTHKNCQKNKKTLLFVSCHFNVYVIN